MTWIDNTTHRTLYHLKPIIENPEAVLYVDLLRGNYYIDLSDGTKYIELLDAVDEAEARRRYNDIYHSWIIALKGEDI